MDLAWLSRQRAPAADAPSLQPVEAAAHPLHSAVPHARPDDAPRADPTVDDPLSAGASDPLSAASDPLTAASSDPLRGVLADPLAVSNTFSTLGSVQLQGVEAVASYGLRKSHFQDWKERRALILKQYAVAGHLRVSSDLLNADGVATAALGSNLDDAGTASDKKVESQLDVRTRRRLEQLGESQDESRSTVRLTQQELITRVEVLESELRRAWEAEERVRALKIAIQLSKMLGDTSYPQFLPSVFALVSGVLDSFGELVFQRVWAKATPSGSACATEVDLSKLVDEGVETTRNWFYKVASIRELVPRLYVEAAILRCYRLLYPASELPIIIARLQRMVRGFGDPLIACYMRAYLGHKVHEVSALSAADLVLEPLWDTMTTFERQVLLAAVHSLTDHLSNRVNLESFEGYVSSKAKISVRDYCISFVPPLEWLLQDVAEQHPSKRMHIFVSHSGPSIMLYSPSQDTLVNVINSYRQRAKSAVFLNSIICSFDQALISEMALSFCELIRETDDILYPRYHCYVSLGKALCSYPPPKDQQLQIVNDIWLAIASIDVPREYVSVALQFMRFLLSEFSSVEVGKLLKDILRHVIPDKVYLDMQTLLQQVVSAVLESGVDFGVYITMEPFQRLLSLFEGHLANSNNKMILDAFSKTSGTFSDPVLINNLTHVARQLHDSLDSLSFADERRQLGVLINAFIRKISFENDFERHLNFFVDCRAAFANLDIVKDTLVLGVFGLAMRTRAAVRGRHTKKTAGFVKACIAFCFITVPSIDNNLLRLNLYFLGAQAALLNSLLPQMDAFFKAAVTLLPEILAPAPPDEIALSRSEAIAREESAVGILSNACSFLVMVPGHPEHGPFYLVTGLLNVMQSCSWRLPMSLPSLYLRMLCLFNALGQSQLPYHITGVDANDVLYAAEPEYADGLGKITSKLLSELLGALKQLGEKGEAACKRAQAALALQLFEIIVATTTLDDPLVALAANLYRLALQSNYADRVHLGNVAQWVSSQAKAAGRDSRGDSLSELCSMLQKLKMSKVGS